jgi:hypothetical protein
MIISQYNGSTSTTPIGDGYFIDRWRDICTQGSKFTRGQNLNSVTPPSGFSNYLGVQIAALATVGAADYFVVRQIIEGYNASDLNWGATAAAAGYTAASVTLSFWVRSNTTGTFGGSVQNGAGTRSYPFTYTINAANTWEYKTVTIPGETTGVWATNNLAGPVVNFSLGTGTTYSGTANTWGSANYLSATGATSLMLSTSNYLYVTGVQFEKGSTATSFDYRPYGTELALCQRYYWQSATNTYSAIGSGFANGTTAAIVYIKHPVSMRALPTFVAANSPLVVFTGSSSTISGIGFQYVGYDSSRVDFTTSGLTAGQGVVVSGNNSTAYVSASAEL